MGLQKVDLGIVDGGREEQNNSVFNVPEEYEENVITDETEPDEQERKPSGDVEDAVEDSSDTEAPTGEKAETKQPEPEEKKDEGTQEKEGKPEPDDLPKGVMKRINKLTKQKYDALRAREQLQKEIESERQRASELEAQLKEAHRFKELSDHLQKMPKEDDFEREADYLMSLAEWAARKERLSAEPEKEEPKREEPKEQPKQVDPKITDMISEGKETYEDFEEVVYGTKWPLSQEALGWIQDSEVAHEIIYHLAKNPDKADKIFDMGGRQLERALTRIELDFINATEDSKPKPIEDSVESRPGQRDPALEQKVRTEEKKVTMAPEPITPLSGKTVTKKDPSRMSNAEYRRMRGFSWKADRRI